MRYFSWKVHFAILLLLSKDYSRTRYRRYAAERCKIVSVAVGSDCNKQKRQSGRIYIYMRRDQLVYSVILCRPHREPGKKWCFRSIWRFELQGAFCIFVYNFIERKAAYRGWDLGKIIPILFTSFCKLSEMPSCSWNLFLCDIFFLPWILRVQVFLSQFTYAGSII